MSILSRAQEPSTLGNRTNVQNRDAPWANSDNNFRTWRVLLTRIRRSPNTSKVSAIFLNHFFWPHGPAQSMLLLHIRAVVSLSKLLTRSVGEGKGEEGQPLSQPTSPVKTQSFAPKGPPRLSRIRQNLPKPLRLKVPNDSPVARIHKACSVWNIKMRDITKSSDHV